jgi:hypothetical protein
MCNRIKYKQRNSQTEEFYQLLFSNLFQFYCKVDKTSISAHVIYEKLWFILFVAIPSQRNVYSAGLTWLHFRLLLLRIPVPLVYSMQVKVHLRIAERRKD